MNVYDQHPYPTSIFEQTTPNFMAVLARLHGLDSPPIETARVLEIGGGDGMNCMAIAAAWPGTRLTSFDLAPETVERGRGWAAAAGLDNVTLLAMDIRDAAAGAIAGPFDYVIAHGIYSWVPDDVRTAVMALIGRVLAPDGIAYVSYTAQPGGWFRLALRDMLATELEGIDDPRERTAAARAFLTAFGEPSEDAEEPTVVAMRHVCRGALTKSDAVLAHDELGQDYHPQSLTQVARAAAAEGLGWLCDARRDALGESMVDAGDDIAALPAGAELEAAVLRRAQQRDWAAGRLFRSSLFVRAGRPIARRIDPRQACDLSMTTPAGRAPNGEFAIANGRFAITDATLKAALETLIDRYPARVPVQALIRDDDRLTALIRMADAGVVHLHMTPLPAAAEAGERPRASPLARMQVAEGMNEICTLDHRHLTLDDPRALAFIALLDGTRDQAALAAEWARLGHAAEIPFEVAMRTMVRGAFLTP